MWEAGTADDVGEKAWNMAEPGHKALSRSLTRVTVSAHSGN